MYESFYNLTEKPFQISTDPRFLWFGEKHREAMANLKYGLLDGNGVVVLTGDVGTGKTTLVNALLDTLDDNVRVVKINHPSLRINEFLTLIAKILDPSVEISDKSDLLLFFNRFLLKAHADGEVVLLLIDEAHRLSMDLLEEIRLLSNIELAGEKLLSIILVGQNEIKPMLMVPQCRALRQRITSIYDIQALSKEETRQYMDYRLNVSGTHGPLFSDTAIHEVYAISRGNPRVINLLCDRALLTGYVTERITIDADIVAECGRELDLIDQNNSEKQRGTLINRVPKWRALSTVLTDYGASAITLVRNLNLRAKRGYSISIATIRLVSGALYRYVEEITSHFYQKYHQKFLPAFVAVGLTVLLVSVTVSMFLDGMDQKTPSTGALMHNAPDREATGATRQEDFRGDALEESSKFEDHLPSVFSLSLSDFLGETSVSELVYGPGIGVTVSKKGPTPLNQTPMELAAIALAQNNNVKAIELLEMHQNSSVDDHAKIAELYAKALVARSEEMMSTAPAESEALLLKAVDVDPSQVDALLMLGKRYIRIQAYTHAIDAYERVVQIDPSASDAFFNLGFLYATIGKYEDAEKSFEKVVLLRPSYLDKTLFNLAVVQQKLGKNEASIANLEEVVTIEPENKKALAYLNQLKISAASDRTVLNR